MGCKEIIKASEYNVYDLEIQSITITSDIGFSCNLNELAKLIPCVYEPELFPALRYIKYNPMCVNIFASGKIVILGIKNIDYKCIVDNIISEIKSIIEGKEFLDFLLTLN